MRSRRLIALSIAALAFAVAPAVRSLLTPEDAGSLPAVAADVLSFEILLGILAAAGAMLSPEGLGARLGLGRGRLSIGQVCLLMLGTLGASFALDGLLDLTGLKEASVLADFERLIAGAHGTELALPLVAFVLAPGLCEELLCRGWVQRGVVRRLGPARGIALAAGIFGALHLDPVHGVFAALLGVYLGLVCHLADSLRAAIACHLGNNLVALLSGALAPELDAQGWLALLLGGAVAAGALWTVWRQVGAPAPARKTGDGATRGTGDAEAL